MARCPNCGREAARTIDWVCQWCGYPLPGGSFKKIDKTFRELKEERLSEQSISEETEETETTSRAKPEPKPKSKPAPEAKPEPVSKLKPEPVRKSQPPPEPPRIKKPAPVANTPVEVKPPESIMPPKPTVKPEPVSEVKPAPVPEAKAEPVRVDIETTVGELLSAYEADGVAADARFINKILRITGIVDKINVKDTLNIYSITLNSPEKSVLLQGVRCVFDRNYGQALNQLSTGQTVTVQGRYTGSMIDISIRDCILS